MRRLDGMRLLVKALALAGLVMTFVVFDKLGAAIAVGLIAGAVVLDPR